jgi:hypothetical protein
MIVEDYRFFFITGNQGMKLAVMNIRGRAIPANDPSKMIQKEAQFVAYKQRRLESPFLLIC